MTGEDKEFINAYIAFIKFVSELDDIKFQEVRHDFEHAGEICGEYFLRFLDHTINAIDYLALEDCINMRYFHQLNKGYQSYQNGVLQPHVRYPWAFEKARERYMKLYPDEYSNKGEWISKSSSEELSNFDKWENGEVTPEPAIISTFQDGEKVNDEKILASSENDLEKLKEENPAVHKLIDKFSLE